VRVYVYGRMYIYSSISYCICIYRHSALYILEWYIYLAVYYMYMFICIRSTSCIVEWCVYLAVYYMYMFIYICSTSYIVEWCGYLAVYVYVYIYM